MVIGKGNIRIVNETKVIIPHIQVFNFKTAFKDFNKGYEQYYNIIQTALILAFQHEEYKELTCTVHLHDGYTVKLRLVECAINMVFWLPKVYFRENVCREDVIDFGENQLTRKFLIQELNRVTEEPHKTKMAKNIVELLCFIGDKYSFAAGITLSIYDIIQLSKRSSKFKYILDFKFTEEDEQKGLAHVNNLLDEATSIIKSSIMDDNENCLVPFIRTGEGVDVMQLRQVCFGIGYRAHISGTIIPKLLNSYSQGLHKPSELFAEAITTRYALAIKKIGVRRSGRLTYCLQILCIDTDVERSIEDCGTVNHLLLTIENKQHLEYICGKFMIKNGNLIKITKEHTNLIGTQVAIRSHAYCALPDGFVCKTCYGPDHKNITNTRIGITPSVQIGARVSNATLKLKHKTFFVALENNDELFSKYFAIDGDEVYLREEHVFHVQLMMQDYVINLYKNSNGDKQNMYNNIENYSSEDSNDDENGDDESEVVMHTILLWDTRIKNTNGEMGDYVVIQSENIGLILHSDILKVVKKKNFSAGNISIEYDYEEYSNIVLPKMFHYQ